MADLVPAEWACGERLVKALWIGVIRDRCRAPMGTSRSADRCLARLRLPLVGLLFRGRRGCQASPASTIASVSNICISVSSLPKTARLAAFQLSTFSAPYM